MNIFVGNMSRQTTDNELRLAFEQFGTVQSANVVKDRDTGVSRGFGFVEMPNNDEANKAIENMHGVEIKGWKLNVNEARPKEEGNKRQGSGFRRQGSGGRR